MKCNIFPLIYAVILFLFSCQSVNRDGSDAIKIDFAVDNGSNSTFLKSDSTRTINVAVAAIISPKETFSYYSELFQYISRKINYKINFKQRKTYQEVNLMLRNNEVDMAFICSGAYVEEKNISGIEILVVPVCNGKPMYQAYIIAHRTSNIENFENLKGKSFAFTDPLSNSGKLYVDKRLMDLNTNEEAYFSSTMFTYAHDISMQLVSKNVVDGATVDGLIFDYKVHKSPESVKNLRIVEKSEEFGIPPIVVPRQLDKKLKQELKEVFLSIHEDPEGKKILDQLLIEKFIEGNDGNYDEIREIKRRLK